MKACLPLVLLLVGAGPPPVAIAGLPLDVLPKQAMPAAGCAAYLWTATETRTLVAMAGAEPAMLRLALDGAIIDLPRTAQSGDGSFGLAATTEYAAPGVRATLDLAIETRGDLVKGGVVSTGSLRLDRDGKDGVVVPVAGIVGCV